MKTQFVAPDIECAGCAASIQKALGRTTGVEATSVDIPTKTVKVDFDATQTSRQALTEILTEIGFPPQTS